MSLKAEVDPINILWIFVIIIIFTLAYFLLIDKNSALSLRDMLNQILCVGC